MPQSFAEEFRSIPMSASLGASLERAHRFARDQSHRAVTLEHLLLSLAEDQEAALILQAANVDLARLGTDVSGYLGRLLEDMRAAPGSEPKPDPELLRVLQAAASAAQQSRRKQIDGAIVLAAIVGDGKSPAAGLLKAHGMTFEEAIRALQRANAQARLKPTAKVAPVQSAEEPQPQLQPETPPPPPPEGRPAMAAATADEILAAARARIQNRAAAAAAKAAAPTPASTLKEALAETAAELDAQLPPSPFPAGAVDGLPAMPPAPEAEPPITAKEASDELQVDGFPEPTMTPPPTRPSWTPPPEQRPHSGHRLPQPPGRTGRPTPPRPVPAAAEGMARQAPPQRAPGPAPAGLRPARAPWAEPPPNGAYPGSTPTPVPNLQARPAPQRGTGPAERGPLIENVPRRMRAGVPATAEVRIARDRIEGLIMALSGRGMAHRPDAFITRALSVRLKAPNGGFWIEAASPETQWVENPTALAHDDYAVWRWTVTPQRSGRGRLLLMVSARTVGQDGIAAESAPPDRVIEVRVRANHVRRLLRWSGWIVLALLGAVLSRYGEELWAAGLLAVRQFAG